MLSLMISALLLVQSAAAQAGTGSIEGRILSPDGKPVAATRVSAIEASRDRQSTVDTSALSRIAQTDSDGHFRLEGVLPGRYYIAVGRVDFPIFYPGVTTVNLAEAVQVRAGGSTNNINFVVGGGSIGGRVVGIPPSLPFPLHLRLSNDSDTSNQISVTADAKGLFEFPRMLPGAYDLLVEQDCHGCAAYPLRVVVQNEDVRNLQIDAPVMVIGRVVIDDGRPLRFAAYSPGEDATTIRILGISNLGIVFANDGFAINSSAPGSSYRIEIAGIPFGYYVKSIMAGSVDLTKDRLVMHEKMYPEVLITLTASRPTTEPVGVNISGRITGGSPGIVILTGPSRAAGSHSGIASVREDGTFNFSNVPPGSYDVQAVSPGSRTTVTTLMVGSADVKDYQITMISDPLN